jgi:hypothetical protein
VRLTENLWVDGGIFFSHIGMESWISRDNPQLTRSLVADYSPYYSSGVKLTWTASSKVAARLDVINGWQNIAENNSGKGAGVRIDVAPSATTTFSYYNFFSDEVGNRLRTFNGVGGKLMVGHTTVLGEIDVGSQGKSAPDGGSASWYGGMLTTRLQFTPRTAIIGRVERYDDKNQIIVSTGNNGTGAPNGALRANGGSIGVDFAPQARVTWRTELRAFANRTAVFPNGPAGEPRKNGGFVVSALALTF